jgi:hypothetical protein
MEGLGPVWRFARTALPTAVVIIVSCASNEETCAQADGRTQRREQVEHLLQSLIDSQLGSVSDSPSGGAAIRSDQSLGPQMRGAQANLAGLSQELSNLVSQLHADVDRVAGVRSLLGDLLRVSASATVLSRRATTVRDIGALRNEYRELDQNWRLLSFRLNQLRGIDTRTKGQIQRCDNFNARLGDLFDVDPQMDQDKLVQQVTQLSNDILDLVDDVDVRVDDPNRRQELLIDGQRVYAQTRRLIRLVSADESHDVIRQEYEASNRLWSPFANKIRALDDRELTRQLLRIQAVDRSIQELLWMTPGVDPKELENITTVLQRDLDELFDGITLRELAELTSGRDRVVAAASEFYSACNDFAECVRNGDNNNTLAEVYDYLNDHWQRFASVTRGVDSRETRQQLREIERGVIELRNAIGVQPALDRQRGIELAGSLENLADHLLGDIERIFSSGARYPQDFQSRCLTAAREFRNTSRLLNQDLVQGENQRSLRQRCDELTLNWEALMAYTTRLPESEQSHLNAVRRRIAPLLVDLQTMFAL